MCFPKHWTEWSYTSGNVGIPVVNPRGEGAVPVTLTMWKYMPQKTSLMSWSTTESFLDVSKLRHIVEAIVFSYFVLDTLHDEEAAKSSPLKILIFKKNYA